MLGWIDGFVSEAYEEKPLWEEAWVLREVREELGYDGVHFILS